jgi:CelD/BcsL family acetyltransferase involved in cellulose biosynthesis
MSLSSTGTSAIHARVGEVMAVPRLAAGAASAAAADIALSIHDDIASLEAEWRHFESVADGTVFQTFAWHAAWQKHIGARAGVRPAIVIGRRAGRILFLMALAIEPGRLIRRLVWHAHDLCDYNAPQLATDFADAVGPGGFLPLFAAIKAQLRRDARFRYDAVVLDKMPETVGGQANPFLALGTTLNPSGAYLTRLGDDWDSFYASRRSSATRKRDRKKRRRLGDVGVSFLAPAGKAAVEANLSVLVDQKSKAFARMGVTDLFARPGYRDFFFELATDPASMELCYVSQLKVGDIVAAANLGLIFRGRYYHILSSYDGGEVARFGPGTAHLQDLMRHAIECGCREFDFTIGDEPYKREWADTELALYDHRSAATAIGLAATLPWMAVARVKRFIKQTPILWRTFSKARAWAGSLKGRRKGALGQSSSIDEGNAESTDEARNPSVSTRERPGRELRPEGKRASR